MGLGRKIRLAKCNHVAIGTHLMLLFYTSINPTEKIYQLQKLKVNNLSLVYLFIHTERLQKSRQLWKTQSGFLSVPNFKAIFASTRAIRGWHFSSFEALQTCQIGRKELLAKQVSRRLQPQSAFFRLLSRKSEIKGSSALFRPFSDIFVDFSKSTEAILQNFPWNHYAKIDHLATP